MTKIEAIQFIEQLLPRLYKTGSVSVSPESFQKLKEAIDILKIDKEKKDADSTQ